MSPPSASVPFVKASACGNDFLIIDGTYAPADLAAFSRAMCDRHEGVGADGVEWLFPAQDADICARIFNADGSEAEISGNGTRCVAAYLCMDEPKEKVSIHTAAGVKTCTLTARSEMEYEFEVAMGQPQVSDKLSVRLACGVVQGIPVSIGNPHFVVFVNEFVPGWQAEAAEIGKHHDFEDGINVELVTVKDRANIEVRFFERGVGETQSSGTGSCAAAAAAISAGKAEWPVRVHTPGGIQAVRWDGQLFLRGFVRIICRGDFLMSNP
jgi:diaminopimelate epimerase